VGDRFDLDLLAEEGGGGAEGVGISNKDGTLRGEVQGGRDEQSDLRRPVGCDSEAVEVPGNAVRKVRGDQVSDEG